MTEQERIDRETLLKRAAAAAGAVYVAPVLTSSASAEADACPWLMCTRSRKCRKEGKSCRCVNGRCAGEGRCSNDARCLGGPPCQVLHICREVARCACFWVTPESRSMECVDFPFDYCSDYPPCDMETGEGCPVGMCCLATCCPQGVCAPPCGTGTFPPVTRGTGSGPTLTL